MWLAHGTALLYNPYESFYNIQWRFDLDMILVLLYLRPPLTSCPVYCFLSPSANTLRPRPSESRRSLFLPPASWRS